LAPVIGLPRRRRDGPLAHLPATPVCCAPAQSRASAFASAENRHRTPVLGSR